MQSTRSGLATLAAILAISFVPLTPTRPGPRDDAPGSGHGRVPSETYEAVFDQLVALEPVARGANVTNLVLERDVARFHLVSGTVYPLSPVNGRTFGIVFVAQGRFTFVPPAGVERGQLRRLMGADSLDVPFDRMVLLFADSTMERLERQLSFDGATPRREAGQHVEYTLKYLSDEKRRYFRSDFLTAVLNDARNGYTYANVRNRGDDPVAVEITPYEAESVRLMRKSKAVDAGETHETVCQFPALADRSVGVAENARDLVHITRYTANAQIAKNLEFSVSVDLHVKALTSGRKWIPFSLYSGFEIDSASWGNGAAAEFFWQEDNPWLWLRVDPALQVGDERVLTLHYHGDFIFEQDDWYLSGQFDGLVSTSW